MGDKNPNIAAIILKGLNIPRRELRLTEQEKQTKKQTYVVNKHILFFKHIKLKIKKMKKYTVQTATSYTYRRHSRI